MIATNTLEKYATFQKTLLGLLESGEQLFAQLQYHGSGKIQTLKEKVMDDQLRVVVLGSFKRGKSTLINAMLGMEILPNFATPCTAVINEIKYGEEKRAVVHFRNNIDKKTFDLLPQKAKDHFKNVYKKNLSPMTIGIDEIVDYVVIIDPEMGHLQSIAETPYDHVEIFWPLPLLKNGIAIIDSPGLDECESRTRITERYLTKADAILFILSCTALAGQSEMEFIDNLLINNGYEDTLFICNRFDEIRGRERERIIEYGRKKLGEKTNFGPEEGVLFLSGSSAIEGRVNNDQILIAKSGIIELERRLYHMLVHSRGKTKLLQPIRVLAQEFQDVIQIVINKRSIANENCLDITYRLKELKRNADREIYNIHQVLEKLRTDLTRIVSDTCNEITAYYVNNFIQKIAAAIQASQQQTTLGQSMVSGFSKMFIKGISNTFSEMTDVVAFKERMLTIGEELRADIKRGINLEQDVFETEIKNYVDMRNREIGDIVLLNAERIVDSLHRLAGSIDGDDKRDHPTKVAAKIDLSTLPKLSEGFIQQPKQDFNFIAVLAKAKIEGMERFKDRGFVLKVGDVGFFTEHIDQTPKETVQILIDAGYTFDTSKKTDLMKMLVGNVMTEGIKKAIGDHYFSLLTQEAKILCGQYFADWETALAVFCDKLQRGIERRIGVIYHIAESLQRHELPQHEKIILDADELIRTIRGIRSTLDELTYDLAML